MFHSWLVKLLLHTREVHGTHSHISEQPDTTAKAGTESLKKSGGAGIHLQPHQIPSGPLHQNNGISQGVRMERSHLRRGLCGCRRAGPGDCIAPDPSSRLCLLGQGPRKRCWEQVWGCPILRAQLWTIPKPKMQVSRRKQMPHF